MLSTNDIKKLLEAFATKQDLKHLKEELATKNQYNNIINKLDTVYKELKDFREEQSAHSNQHEDSTPISRTYNLESTKLPKLHNRQTHLGGDPLIIN